MKFAVIGGGSTYTPEFVDGLKDFVKEVPIDELYLMDISAERLEIVGGLAKRIIENLGLKIKVNLTTNAEEAIKDADFIITQIRVGGIRGRIKDEKVPLKHDLIGQETTGPGGFAMALRTIPVMLNYAEIIEKYAKNAWWINFTNPSGLVTEALARYSNTKVIGLCNIPINILKMFSEFYNVPVNKIFLDYIGLNHFSWVRKVYINGRDVLPEVIQMIEKNPELAEEFGSEIPSLYKMLPNYYLKYYWHKDIVLEKLKKAPKTRGEQVLELEGYFLNLYKNPELKEKPADLDQKRGGRGYSEAALTLISAICNDKNEIHIVNVPNQGAIEMFPKDAVAEIPCVVNKSGAHPIKLDPPEPEIRGLLHMVKSYELLTAEAAVTGSYELALKALMTHPLVLSYEKAKAVLDDLLIAHRDYLPQFKDKIEELLKERK